MWSALTSSSNFVLESLETFVESTGIAGLLANMGWGSLVMICVAFFLLYLAIKHKFEPLLLLTIAFGMLLTNLPGANLYHTELFAGGHVHWDIFVANAGLLDYLYLGVKLGIYPCLIFVGVGAMTDFGPLIANPKSFLLLPSAAPLVGCLMLGNLMKECGVVDRLSKTVQNELMNIVVIFLGLTVGATATAEAFLNPRTLFILLLGVIAFGMGTAGGVLLAKLMNLFSKEGNKINPLIGSAGVSAVPMAARVSQTEGQKADPSNFLLMHAMGPNVAGVVGSAVAAGILLSFLG